MAVQWVTGFLDFPGGVFAAAQDFWRGVTGYALSPPRGPRADFATLMPGEGDAYLRVQRIYDGPAGCHLDFHAQDWAALAARAAGSEHLMRPAGMPLRLLLQRTGDPPGTTVRAHPDLACSGTGAEVARHEGLGATQSHDGDGWVTMRDPAGMTYCITRRDPGNCQDLWMGAAPTQR